MGFRDENILNALNNVSKFLNTILFTGSNLKVKNMILLKKWLN